MSGLVLALPSKGRIQEETLAFLKDCGLPVRLEGRGYAASLPALPDIEVRLLSAGAIPTALLAGECHLGVTGEDLLREASPDLTGLVLALPLGVARADVVVAAPIGWLDVETVEDFAAACAQWRARSGDRLRIATKYQALARAFFTERGLVDYRLVDSAGATEGAPAAFAAEAIVDITSTGETLAANQLRPLRDGVILRSQAQLAASLRAPWTPAAMAALEQLLDAIEARARGKGATVLQVFGAPLEPALAEAAAAHGCELLAEGPGMVTFSCPRPKAQKAAAALAQGPGVVVAVEAQAIHRRPSSAMSRIEAALRAAGALDKVSRGG